MAYIANKPVRFDKDYSIGEIIPDDVIDSKMGKKLISWGKILYIGNGNSNADNRESTQEENNSADVSKNSKKNSPKKR